jgi:peptidoglycan/xylan/chitin deacetylase (PgdA/CDA1 family)
MKVVYPFIFIAFIFGSFGNTYAEELNTVPNFSFELPSSENPYEPDSWFPDWWGTLTPKFSYPVPGRTGNGAQISITNYKNGDAKWFFVPQVVTPLHRYTFSDYYLSTAQTHIIVQFTLATGRFQYQVLGSAPASSEWKNFSASFTIPSNAVKVSIFHVLASDGSLSVDDYTFVDDDISLPQPIPDSNKDIVPTPQFIHTHLPPISGNLIKNPSFENGIKNSPTSWLQDSWGNNVSTFVYPTAGYTGARAARVTVSSHSSGDAKWFFAPVPALQNTDYLYSDYYLSTTQTIVIAQFTLADGERRYAILSVLSPKSMWTKMEQTFTTPPGTVAVSILHVIASIGSLTIDSASLHQLSSGAFSKGMVSLSFDDNDFSFLANAVPLLDAYGFLATQNVPVSLIGQNQKMTVEQLKILNERGYEIDSHSVTHPFLTALSSAEASEETKNSLTQLRALGLLPLTVFAYPYGDYNDEIATIVQASGYTAARGTTPGFNTRNTNIFGLHTQNVLYDTPVSQVKQWIDQAMAHKMWLILGFHEIGDGGDTYDYPADSFGEILKYLKESQTNVVTTNTALREMR